MPRATVARLPVYLQCLDGLPTDRQTVSSEELAAASNVTAAQVRKDLSHLGSNGVRGVGYDTQRLRRLIQRELGLTGDVPVAIVGVGNLGTALANYQGFGERGFRIVALFDSHPAKVGASVRDHTIRHLDQLDPKAGIAIGIIATPGEAAQQVADRLAGAGVRSILNFAPAVVRVPPGVEVRNVDLSTELQILSFYLAHPAKAG
ncbi:MAG: redox-sensing transcriptional repressor Rex [Acidimicrobiia bacterium]